MRLVFIALLQKGNAPSAMQRGTIAVLEDEIESVGLYAALGKQIRTAVHKLSESFSFI